MIFVGLFLAFHMTALFLLLRLNWRQSAILSDVAMTKNLLRTWAMCWDQSPDQVKAALAKVLEAK